MCIVFSNEVAGIYYFGANYLINKLIDTYFFLGVP